MSPIAYVFPKLRMSKDVVRKMSKKSRFRGSLDRQHGKWAKTDSIWTAAPSLYSLIIVKVIELEKVSLGNMESVTTVS